MNRIILTLAALALAAPCWGQATSSRVDYSPQAPVVLVKPSGQAIPYGVGAATDAARGAALEAALVALADGDAIRLATGAYTVPDDTGTAVIATITNKDLTIAGCGPGVTIIQAASDDTLVELAGTSHVNIKDLSIGSAACITFGGVSGDFDGVAWIENVSASVQNPIDVTSGDGEINWIDGFIDAPTGFALDPTGCTVRFFGATLSSTSECLDMSGAACTVELHDTHVVTTGSAQTAINVGGSTLRAYTGRITSESNGLDIDVSGTCEVGPGFVYSSAKTSGTITNLIPIVRSFQFQPFAVGDTVTTGDGKVYYAVPAMINGSVITAVRADLLTASSSGAPNFDLTRIRSGTPVDILSTNLTVDQDETTSADATTPAVINTSNDDLQTGDLIRLDVDTAGTSTDFPMITVEVTQ